MRMRIKGPLKLWDSTVVYESGFLLLSDMINKCKHY